MKKILIRSGKDYFTNISPEATFSYRKTSTFGHNVGFYLISDAVYKLISTPDTQITVDSFSIGTKKSYKRNVAETIDENFDSFVIPAADFLKPEQIKHLKRLTILIKNLDIPICVLGLGIGAYIDSYRFNDEKTDKVVKNFISSILEKSDSIGVRGQLTFNYLNKLGFDESQIKVLGCPSIYLNGANYNIKPPSIDTNSKIALNITPSVKKYTPFVDKTIKKYKNYKYFMQDARDLKILLYGENDIITGNSTVSSYKNILDDNKAIFPIETRIWIDELKNYDYAIGTRLHGTIAALNAGIPGTLIVHDSRTQEIADYHKIPHLKIDEIDKNTSIEDIANNSNWEEFNKVSKTNYKDLVKFFKVNKIDITKEYPNPIIDKKEKEIRINRIVEQIYSKSKGINEKELLSRINYLSNKEFYDYKPPFSVKNEKSSQKVNKGKNSKFNKIKKIIKK